MKNLFASLFVLATVSCASLAFAGSDDATWIAQCIQDNKDAKVSVDVITKYCTCMNDKMDENETQSITQWEKSHPKERTECDKESGWK
ncbi:hypothetical protein [Megalodesulfovibrio gigas]|uniref:Lipoprotein n=1 Tax=Megalodesulfovibrio gigas (strain ATCC 19364 / DSM 1382 / NCIMB 9332 / VKM B-1759) TaxID=1121448 RepID=T2G6H3_MEGG1|nr:hypothetical protein [Megalodesulfovibrio gigas]AGW12170.1 hypothetical protein DGI_0238 [Megalodesulfovibrio gigas DSM 1382 = ATCC 19364]